MIYYITQHYTKTILYLKNIIKLKAFVHFEEKLYVQEAIISQILFKVVKLVECVKM